MKESVSAMMDGELEKSLSEEELSLLYEDESFREIWNTYHLIGDAMRNNSVLATDVRYIVAERLKIEPVVQIPKKWFRETMRWQRWVGGIAVTASIMVAVLVTGGIFNPRTDQSVEQALNPSIDQQRSYDFPDVDNPYLSAHQEMMTDINVAHYNSSSDGDN